MSGRSLNLIISEATEEYLADIDPQNPPDIGLVEPDLLQHINDMLDLQNSVLPKARKFKIITYLPPFVIARVISFFYPVYRIPCAGNDCSEDHDILGIYKPDEGIYDMSESTFRRIARPLNKSLSRHDFEEFMNALRDTVERKALCEDPDLIAVNNGVFNFKTKELMPFTPDLVFLSKSRVDYIENPVNPVIHNPDDGTDWDVESWLHELTDDVEITQLLWQIIGAIIRPNVRWNRSAWFYSEKGENGKGTLCELIRNICGPETHVSLPLANFGDNFALEPLLHATAIITDENSVGCFITKADGIKAVITNDVINVNRKFKTPITFRFRGYMVQCINELPRMKDKSDSLYRRQLFVPFNKSFTGRARTYIKDSYVKRQDVLEYVLHRVLNMNYYKLSEPRACKALLDEYKDYNDPVRQFAEEILPQLQWDFAPYGFIYDLYKAWFRDTCPSGLLQGRNTFIKDLRGIMAGFPDWLCCDKNTRPGQMMSKPEMLILQYNLLGWMNNCYTGADLNKKCIPSHLKQAYTGIIRVKAAGAGIAAYDDDDAA